MLLNVMAWDKLALFTGGELLFSLAPGPTVIMISAYGFKGGFREALSAICGTQAGNTLWYVLCALGLGALIAASPLAFSAIRYLGAAYLIWLGSAALWHSRHPEAPTRDAKLRANPFVQAFLTQMGNPKALLFFGAFVPQFLDTHAPLLPQYAVMYAITLVGEGVILAGYGWLAAAGGRMAATSHAVWRERISGAVLIGLGVLFAAAPPINPEDFITANAARIAPPLVPEIVLYLATEVEPIWRKTEEELAHEGVPPPYWAFAWAGGQALARHVLDHPASVRGRRVLDLGSGSGLVGIAAAKAGAASVMAADIDAFACAAVRLNADANSVAIATTQQDVIGTAGDWDVILVGDLFYERPLAERLMAWLRTQQATVLLGDPGRSYFPKIGLEKLASYSVATTRDLEDREIRETGVYKLSPP